jgi:hypothetical protein
VKARWLSWAFFYFSESGLFNGLWLIQISKSPCLRLRAKRLKRLSSVISIHPSARKSGSIPADWKMVTLSSAFGKILLAEVVGRSERGDDFNRAHGPRDMGRWNDLGSADLTSTNDRPRGAEMRAALEAKHLAS